MLVPFRPQAARLSVAQANGQIVPLNTGIEQ